jgi:hypothetical protein
VNFPRRTPHEIAAELFKSCSWEEAGNPIAAADKAAYYLFQEFIVRLGVDHDRRRELIDDVNNANARAELDIGINRARRVLQRYARPLTRRRLNHLKDRSLIDRLDMMPGGPNVHELARQIASETKTAPTETEIETIERRIQKLNAKRKNNPYWPQRRG